MYSVETNVEKTHLNDQSLINQLSYHPCCVQSDHWLLVPLNDSREAMQSSTIYEVLDTLVLLGKYLIERKVGMGLERYLEEAYCSSGVQLQVCCNFLLFDLAS